MTAVDAPPLQVLIADDEAMGRERLKRLLGDVPNSELLGMCRSGPEVLDALSGITPDVLLLDIRMPGMSGFDIARAVSRMPRVPLVIFVTAFGEHALDAFELHAIDYLLKPVEPERFRAAMERARELVTSTSSAMRLRRLVAFLRDEIDLAKEVVEPLRASRTAEPSGNAVAPLTRFLIKLTDRMFFVDVDEIDWVEAYGNYVRLHVGKSVHMTRETMRTLERRLDQVKFARIHRSAIVNLDRVLRMDLLGSGDYLVLLKDGTKLKLSRWYRTRIEKLLR